MPNFFGVFAADITLVQTASDMFNGLKCLFTGEEDTTDLISKLKLGQDSGHNPNFLIEPKEIQRILGYLKNYDALIYAEVSGVPGHFSTSVLEFDETHGFLYFDELNPINGHRLLVKAGKFKATSYYQGVEISFNAAHIKTTRKEGITRYKARIPNRIYYPQRRRAHRIRVSALNPIPFIGNFESHKGELRGHVHDLSNTGIGLIVYGFLPTDRDDQLQTCQIVLPKGQTVWFDLRLKFVEPASQGDRAHIGGVFENIDQKNQKKLERFLAAIERAELKRKIRMD